MYIGVRILSRLMCFVFVLMVAAATAHARDVTVFAAASLANAMAAVAKSFSVQSVHRMKVVLAGSSTLARQIEAGADADLFLSADEAWMSYLEERGLIDPMSRQRLLTNSLVLVVPKARSKSLQITADDKWLEELGKGRIAVGDPEHVPVGKYAMSALKALDVWARVQQRLAPSLHTRAALAWVERGEAVAAIVYATDARASRAVVVAGQFPVTKSAGIAYPIGRLVGKDDDAVEAAYKFIVGVEARGIFRQHGFGGG